MMSLLLFPFTLLMTVFGWIFGLIGGVIGWIAGIFGRIFGFAFSLAGGVLGLLIRLGMYAGIFAIGYIVLKSIFGKKSESDDPMVKASSEQFKSFYEDRTSSVK